MDDLLREKRRQAGKLGGLACVARHGKAQMARQLKANHDAHYLSLVDPTGALDARDRAERAKAVMDAQLARARMGRLMARSDARLCPWCVRERGETFPNDETSAMCKRHARQLMAQAHVKHPQNAA